jgi:membrane fusion protein, multidrug efflux system
VKIRAQFDNTDNALFPNQFVNARLLVKTLDNAVTVPTSAILRGSPGAYVYIINADSTVSVRKITTSAVDGNVTAVTSGLSPGERVVIDGTDRLRDGLKVVVAADQAAAGNDAHGTGQPGGQHGGGKGGGNQSGEHGAAQRQNSDGSQSPPPPSGQ